MIVLYVLMPVSCLFLGFAVAAIRPRDPLAWLLLLLMVSFAQFGTGEVEFGTLRLWPDWIRQAALFYRAVAGGLWSICMLLFAVYFPERLTLDRRLPWLKWLFIIPIGAQAFASAAFVVADSENFRAAARLVRSFRERASLFSTSGLPPTGASSLQSGPRFTALPPMTPAAAFCW